MVVIKQRQFLLTVSSFFFFYYKCMLLLVALFDVAEDIACYILYTSLYEQERDLF